MLYILGGSSRSGKSITGRRFVKELAIPFFCIDFLTSSLQEIESLQIRHGLPFIEKAEKLWPLVKPLLGHLLREEPDYFIEGDGILPKHIRELFDEYPGEVKVCFVGFADTTPDQKLKEVREFGNQKDDWTKRHTDEEVKVFLQDMITFSNYIKNECGKYEIKYFDVSFNFNERLDEVFHYLSKSK